MTAEPRTVAEAIARNGERHPGRFLVFQDMEGRETRCTFAELDRETARRAAGLQALGLGKGDTFGLVVIEPEAFILTFLAAARMGALPVPLYPPMSFGSLDAYADRTARVLADAGAKLIVASKRLENVLWGLVDRVPTCTKLVAVDDLAKHEGTPALPELSADDLCFLQYTSGSTSDPKGVLVTHGNLIANTRALSLALDLDGDNGTIALSWLPLYHDMGLIGQLLTPVLRGFPGVFLPTMRFIKKPMSWLEAITAHKATVSFAPNFAYALVGKRVKPADLAKLDLSSMRVFGCGAEPINAEAAQLFLDTFAPCGLRPDAFVPAYGMAEATLAMSFKPRGVKFGVSVVDTAKFQAGGKVVAPETDDTAVAVHVSCGVPLPGHSIAVFTEDGEPVADGVEGELCFGGPSVTPGYFRNPEATAAARRGAWLRTGDLGYVLNGEVYVTGRLKDLIILNGKNIHPQSVEWVAAEVEGVRKGNVVAFSVPGADAEEIVLVLESDAADMTAVVDAVKLHVQRELSLAVAAVVCVAKGTLPKTSSGKVQRRKTRQQYLDGEIGRTGPRTFGATGDNFTLARHVARSLWSRAKATVLLR